jgi:hypothetical protein
MSKTAPDSSKPLDGRTRTGKTAAASDRWEAVTGSERFSVPPVAVLVAGYIGWRCVGFFGTLSLTTQPGFWQATPLPYQVLSVLEPCWLAVQVVLAVALLRRSRRGWAAMTALLGVGVAWSLADVVRVLVLLPVLQRWRNSTSGVESLMGSMTLDGLPWRMLWTAILAGLVVWLFRSAREFGVEHRRSWSTMLREGWWAGALTLAFHVPQLLWMAFSRL